MAGWTVLFVDALGFRVQLVGLDFVAVVPFTQVQCWALGLGPRLSGVSGFGVYDLGCPERGRL